MKTILKHRESRKSFLIIVGFILLFIILFRIFVIPKFYPLPPEEISSTIRYIENLLDSLFISLLVAVFLGLFIFYIEVPETEKKHEIVEPNRIKEIFVKGRLETDFWYFSGGTGRFTRAITIPELCKISKEKNEHRSIKIILLDPMDDSLCVSYASYRQNLKSSKNEWTKKYVRNEIIATICSAIIHKSINPMLDINIYLKKNFSTLRIDINKTNCIVTKEDKKEPALLTPFETFLYRTYKEEILQVAKQCREIDMRCKMVNVTLGKISPSDIEEICLHLQYNSKLEDTDFKEISVIINKNENPY
jgi:hypothetical protein